MVAKMIAVLFVMNTLQKIHVYECSTKRMVV